MHEQVNHWDHAVTSKTMSCPVNGGCATQMPVVFIPHGGGPCFQMPDPQGLWKNMRKELEELSSHLPQKPKGLVVISGHWESSTVAIQGNMYPDLYYDYSGFPDYTYKLQWPASGSPEMAQRVAELLARKEIPSRIDDKRGYDHGVFVPLLVAYPEADLPTIQVSLRSDLDPEFHYKMGEALKPLRDEGILILASGFTYHNLRDFFNPTARVEKSAQEFDEWLTKAVTHSDVTVRKQKLAKELNIAPSLRQCHPRTEHLIPLVVAAGAAGEDIGVQTLSEKLFGKIAHSGYWFGERI